MKYTLASLAFAHAASAALNVDLTNSGTLMRSQSLTFTPEMGSKGGKTDLIAGSIKTAAKQVADNLLGYYKGNQSGEIPGVLPGPPPQGDYYWWESGAMWGALVDYWRLTGDESFNEVTNQGLRFQVGQGNNYMPANWSAAMGNDDQGTWGMAALLAAESGFQNPPSNEEPWMVYALAVAHDQAMRLDKDTCGGGLRWQIFFSNVGYDYKNSLSNGVFFNIAARLGRLTGNNTYNEWASAAWDWVSTVGLMSEDFDVYDGAHVATNCSDINKAQFSNNAGVYLQGAAYMYNQVRSSYAAANGVA
jgi:mannan endo-1,6-alpha-mannosidase